MSKTRWAVKACSLALCLCLAGCTAAPDIPQPTLDELLAEVNAEHQKIEMPHINRASYLRDAPDEATVEKYLLEDVQAALKGMLAPKYRDVDLGRCEVRQVYRISNVGAVAGCYVLEGKITRGAKIRVVRDGIIIADDELSSLKRFKDDVKEVASGYECGISLVKFNDIKEGDVFEAYLVEEYRE